MADFMTPSQRSRAMSKVKGKETKIEQNVRSYLHCKGYRFKKNVKDLPGKPDIFLPRYKAVVFINGCFWHHHEGCTKNRLPKTHKDFWYNKIQGNIGRDKQNINQLLKSNLRVAVLWECCLKKSTLFSRTMNLLVNWIGSSENFIEIPVPME
jgi:DNA mismatch endonuclease (patch repair protein)